MAFRSDLARAIAKRLFTDGFGNVARRLVHEAGSNLDGYTGWCETAAADQIDEILREAGLVDPVPMRKIKGRCPSCGADSLFLGEGGFVTCSVIGCKDPGAATEVLDVGVRKALEEARSRLSLAISQRDLAEEAREASDRRRLALYDERERLREQLATLRRDQEAAS